MTKKETLFYPSEWYPQDAVVVAWPNKQTDWKSNLEEAVKTYTDIVSKISEFEKVIVLCDNKSELKKHFSRLNTSNIILVEVSYNDTWTRDYAPITVFESGTPKLLDFQFNGWGAKYDASLDNGITKKLYQNGTFNPETIYSDLQYFVLEGGSIDTDGNGTMLTTKQCLLSRHRNPGYSSKQIEEELKKNFGVQNVYWLGEGDIEGDDTDGHIDTLAKFCNEKTIVYASCDKESDVHFVPLKKMEEGLKECRNINNGRYELVKLPLPEPIYNSKNKRLPATYVNFLITNEAVLLPAYNSDKDYEAEGILKNIFTDKKVLLIDCLSLIQQYGSLHCITMQIPKTTLKT